MYGSIGVCYVKQLSPILDELSEVFAGQVMIFRLDIHEELTLGKQLDEHIKQTQHDLWDPNLIVWEGAFQQCGWAGDQ